MAKRKGVDLGGLDAVLPSGDVDLIASVIQSDRRRAGRGEFREDQAAPDYDTMTSPMTSPPASLPASVPASPSASQSADVLASPSVRPSVRVPVSPPASPQTDIDTITQATVTEDQQQVAEHKATQRPRKERPPAPRMQRNPPAKPSRPQPHQLLDNRIRHAEEMSNSRTMTVTLRLPQELNDWLDEYVHESWRERIKKQQLVVEALRMLVARRGAAGEEILPTELLGDQ